MYKFILVIVCFLSINFSALANGHHQEAQLAMLPPCDIMSSYADAGCLSFRVNRDAPIDGQALLKFQGVMLKTMQTLQELNNGFDFNIPVLFNVSGLDIPGIVREWGAQEGMELARGYVETPNVEFWTRPNAFGFGGRQTRVDYLTYYHGYELLNLNQLYIRVDVTYAENGKKPLFDDKLAERLAYTINSLYEEALDLYGPQIVRNIQDAIAAKQREAQRVLEAAKAAEAAEQQARAEEKRRRDRAIAISTNSGAERMER